LKKILSVAVLQILLQSR